MAKAKGKPALPVIKAQYVRTAKGVYINITVTSTSSAPVESLKIQRWKGTTQLYTDLTTLQGGTRFHLDDSLEDGETYAYRVQALNSDAGSDYSVPSGKVTIIDPPEPPTNCTAQAAGSATSDVMGINHTLVTSVRAPVDGFYLFRSDFGAAFKQVNKYTAPLNYVTNQPPPDTASRYRTHPYNNTAGAGRYMSNISGTVYTTPEAPTGFTAAWDSAGNIIGTWTNPSKIAQKVESEHSTDGSTWFPVPAPSSGTKLTHKYPERGVAHHYRIRNVTPKPGLGEAKVSAWVYAPVVAADQTPMAPTPLGPNYNDPAGNVLFNYRHNTVDGTPAMAVRFRHRLVGTTAWTTTASYATNTAFQLPYSVGQTAEWAVQTQGEGSGTWSQWSAPRRIYMRRKPNTVITNPTSGMVVRGPSLVATWTGGSNSYGIELWKNGVLEYKSSGSNSLKRTVPLTNDGTYEMKVTTFDGYLWSGWTSRTFTTSFTPPTAPLLQVSLDELQFASNVLATRGSGGVAVTRLEVLGRTQGDSEWSTVFDSVSSGVSKKDLLIPLGVPYEYQAKAWTAAGGYALSPIRTVTLNKRAVVINYGEGLASRAVLITDLDINASEEIESDTAKLGSRVMGFREERSSLQIRVGGTVPKNTGSPFLDWGKVVRSAELHYRDPMGRSFPCLVGGVSTSNKKSELTEVDFSVERLGTW